jgi:hypothetical protein
MLLSTKMCVAEWLFKEKPKLETNHPHKEENFFKMNEIGYAAAACHTIV